ncbi:MAG: hypothetical protein AAGH82_04365 [Pseudomonadota bacterium]
MHLRAAFVGLTAGLAFAAPAFLSSAAAQDATPQSAYTKLNLDACTLIEEFEEGMGASLECPEAGFGGTTVYAAEGDLRWSLGFGEQPESWTSFAPFNSLGTTIEWRYHGDSPPHAAILRFFLDSGDPETGKAQALVVHKVLHFGGGSCPIAIVDASVEQANGVARGAAALASTLDCATHTPIYTGPGDSLANSFNGARIEGANVR